MINLTKSKLHKQSVHTKISVFILNPKSIKFVNNPKRVNLSVVITSDTSENVIFDGENVIFDGEQVIA